MKKIAVFDIDNTVISNDSWVNFVNEMIRRSKIPFFSWFYVYFVALLFVCRILPIEKVKNLWLKLISDMNEEQLDLYCKEYVSKRVLPFVKKGVKEEIADLKADGYLIIFATASLEIYARYIADYFDADIFVGTLIVRENGKYVVSGKNCKKKEKINRILKKINIDEIDIEKSVSFSDSLSDLPFLDITKTFNLVHKHKWLVVKQTVSD